MTDEEVIDNFLNEICEVFPEIKQLMESHDDYMTTSKMEEFANATTKAFAKGNVDLAKKYLKFMSDKLYDPHPKEFEFIDVYYVENLFWKANAETIKLGWPLVPGKLKNLYVAFHGRSPL